MVESIVLDWKGRQGLDAATRDIHVALSEEGACLARRQVLAEEMGNCNARDVQPFDDWTWARKDFWLDDQTSFNPPLDKFRSTTIEARIETCLQPESKERLKLVCPRAFGGKVSAHTRCVKAAQDGSARMVIEFNGHPQSVPWLDPEGGPRREVPRNYWQLIWATVSIPAEWLRRGQNTVILRTEDGSRWEAMIEVSRFPNHSARSDDQGVTWNYDHLGYNGCYDGEFLVRMELERHPRQGQLTSPPFDLAQAVAENGLGKPLTVRRLSLQVQGSTPPGTALEAQLRAGPTPTYDPKTWSAWRPADDLAMRPGDRFAQWRITLQTDDPLTTPTLRGVQAAAEVEVAEGSWGRLVDADNRPILRSSFPFGYQAPTARTRMLRERWHLDDVLYGEEDLSRLRCLAEWVRDQWTDGWNRDWKALRLCPPWDGALILELASHDLSQGMCTHYSTAFVHACASLGIPARHVIHKAHCTSEAWSDHWGKWIWFDVGGDMDDRTRAAYHVERDGVPLSVLEARTAWQEGKLAGMRLVGRKAEEVFRLEQRLDLLDHFCIVLRNDQMTSLNPGEPEHGVMTYHYDGYLWWRDERIPPLPWFSLSSNREADLYWTLNRTRIHLQRTARRGVLNVKLESCTPHLQGLQVRLSGGEWEERPADFEWPLQRGDNLLEARSVSAFGLPGPASWVKVELD